ncbi:MAG: hypothetical protein JKY15_06125, partial [Deltaproteobacteria bacterium]|nr:hypothetical protein [Deltaproteobacteria bacterium]
LFTERTRAKAHCDWQQPGCLEERTLAAQVLPKLENLNTHAHELLEQIQENPNKDLSQLLALFPRRFLESMISQPAKSNIVDAYSLESVQAEYADGQRFIDNTLKPLINTNIISQRILKDPELFKLAQLAEKSSLTDKTSQRVLRFIDEIPDTDKPELIRLVGAFEKLGILPMFLNSSFMQMAAKVDEDNLKRPYEWPLLEPNYGFSTPSSANILKEFTADYEKSKDYLQILQDKKEQLTAYDLSVWSKAEKFVRARKDFKTKFENYFTSEQFLGFKNSLETMAATSVMESYVELFDNSIKMLKSTPNANIANFKTRVEDYLNLLKAWGPKAPQEFVKYHEQWGLSRYLEQVTDLLNAKRSLQTDDLRPSQMFSVSAAAIGATTDFERHFPINLEDFFTLIHQSLNTFMGAWNTQTLVDLVTPANFQYTWHQLQGQQFPVFLTGVKVGNGVLEYSINMPLKNHSAKIGLSYQRSTDSVSVKFFFIGPNFINSPGRWNLILDYALLEALENKLVISDIVENEYDIQFRLDSLNKNPIFPLNSFKDSLATIANTGHLPDIVFQSLMDRYPSPKMKEWIIAHEAMGLAFVLPRGTLNEEEKLEIASIGIQSLRPTNQMLGITVLERLVLNYSNNELVNEKAKFVLKELSSDPKFSTQQALFWLMNALIEKRIGIEEIALIAEKNSHSSEPAVKAFSLGLFGKLAANKKYRSAALKAAEEINPNSASMVLGMGLYDLFPVLIRYNLGLASAFKLAKKEIFNPDSNVQRCAAETLSALIDKQFETKAIGVLVDRLLKTKGIAEKSPYWLEDLNRKINSQNSLKLEEDSTVSGNSSNSGPPSSSNPTMQSLLDISQEVQSDCPGATDVQRSAFTITQAQADGLVRHCSDSDLLIYKTFADCYVDAVCGSSVHTVALDACTKPSPSNISEPSMEK